MASPVKPSDFKAELASPSGSKCQQLIKALLGFPALFYQFVTWLIGEDGLLTKDAILAARIVKPGDYIFSASPLLEDDTRVLCNGQAVSREDYADLYAAIGTVYGVGNGSTTFNVPNFTERFPVGVGGDYDLGDTGGEASHSLILAEMPPHEHNLLLPHDNSGGTLPDPEHPSGDNNGPIDFVSYPTTTVGGTGPGPTVSPHENRPPYLACYVYVKT